MKVTLLYLIASLFSMAAGVSGGPDPTAVERADFKGTSSDLDSFVDDAFVKLKPAEGVTGADPAAVEWSGFTGSSPAAPTDLGIPDDAFDPIPAGDDEKDDGWESEILDTDPVRSPSLPANEDEEWEASETDPLLPKEEDPAYESLPVVIRTGTTGRTGSVLSFSVGGSSSESDAEPAAPVVAAPVAVKAEKHDGSGASAVTGVSLGFLALAMLVAF